MKEDGKISQAEARMSKDMKVRHSLACCRDYKEPDVTGAKLVRQRVLRYETRKAEGSQIREGLMCLVEEVRAAIW